MPLYLLSFTNDDGEDFGLLITADTITDAVALFRKEWDDMFEPTDFAGPILPGPSHHADALHICEVRATGQNGVLAWHTRSQSPAGEVVLVGWVTP